jgi:hypothetical protein
MIERMDEIVSHKANKVAFDDAVHKINMMATKEQVNQNTID